MAAPEFDEEKAKRYLVEQAKRAIAVRSKDREFHGLEREFMYHQSQMVFDYEKSKDIKHPRDLGSSREEILRKFLNISGLLPQRYAVSQESARVAAPSGHTSKEIDILLYDPLDSVCLMNREGVYQVFPIESVYGVIQVKSRLNKNEIKDGLENIASFKSLERPARQPGFVMRQGGREERGFGVLFAYDSDLEWREIVNEVEAFAKANPNHHWCNGVFILNKGVILYGDGNSGKTCNRDLQAIKELEMFGFPDRQNLCLGQFHSVLLELLRKTDIGPANLDRYFRLPLISDALSYEFCLGSFAECGSCSKHGDYQRKIAPEALTKLIEWCKKTTPINWIKATDLAYGKAGDDEKVYARQPGDVRIYNPENLPLSSILVGSDASQGLTFDQIRTEGMIIYIPHCYNDKGNIISGCPKCKQ